MNKELELALKTSIAVGITLTLGKLLKIDSLFYAGIASAICSQIEMKESIRAGIGRIYGTIVGAILGVSCFYFFPRNIISMTIGIFIIVYTSYKYLKTAQANIASIVFLGIMLEIKPNETPIYYFFHRVLDTSLGVMIAIFVSNFRLISNKRV